MVTYEAVPSTKIFCLLRKETTYTYDRDDDNYHDLLRTSKWERDSLLGYARVCVSLLDFQREGENEYQGWNSCINPSQFEVDIVI